jgi:hypothetical protein
MQILHRPGECLGASRYCQLVLAHGAYTRCLYTQQFGAFHHFHRVQVSGRDDDPSLGFAEKQSIQPSTGGGGYRWVWRREGGQINPSANEPRGFASDLLADATFGQGYGQSTLAAVMGALDRAGMDQCSEREVEFAFLFQTTPRRRAGFEFVNELQVSRAA